VEAEYPAPEFGFQEDVYAFADIPALQTYGMVNADFTV